MKADEVWNTFIANPSYKAIYQHHHGRPLLTISAGTPSPFGTSLPTWEDQVNPSRFSVRWVSGWLDTPPGGQPIEPTGKSNYWSFKDRLRLGLTGLPVAPTYNVDPENGIPEHAAVVPAFAGQTRWGEAGGQGRNGVTGANGATDCNNTTAGIPGITFNQEWQRVRNIDPEIVTVATWNEWIRKSQPPYDTGDEYTPVCSSDIEPSVAWSDAYLTSLRVNINQLRAHKTDLVLRDANTGRFRFRNAPDFYFDTEFQWPTNNGGSNYEPLACDLNADGYGDILLRDSNNGVFYYRLGPTFASEQNVPWYSGTNYQPFVGDFNRDNKCDLGLRDANTGLFYWRLAPTFSLDTERYFQWPTNSGGSNYQPFAGYFNNDPHLDIGLRDANNGVFYWRLGPNFDSEFNFPWAMDQNHNYQPIIGDFNGDGYSDIGLRDANNGVITYRTGPDFSTNQSQVTWLAGFQFRASAVDVR